MRTAAAVTVAAWIICLLFSLAVWAAIILGVLAAVGAAT